LAKDAEGERGRWGECDGNTEGQVLILEFFFDCQL